jgi:EmrB/QacA subfamily drug resistance transporter
MASSTSQPTLLGVERSLLRLVAVVSLGAIMSLLDVTIVNVAIDTLTEDLDAGLSTVGWVSTGYMLAFAVSIPIGGWAVDRFGSRRVWLTGLVAFTTMSLLAGLSPSIGFLIAARVMQGLAGGLLEPTMMTVVARAAGPSRVGRVLGLSSITVTLGPILGPVLGGSILEFASWHWLFIVNVPIGVVALWLALRYLPRDAGEGDRTQLFDARGVALLSPGFALAIYAISEVGLGRRASDAGVIVPALLAVGFLVGYGMYALRTPVTPIVDVRMFRNRAFSGAVGAITLLGLTFISSGFLFPLFFQQVRGHSVMEAGLLMIPQGVGAMLVMPFAGRLSDRIGSKPLVFVGGVLGFVNLSILAWSDASTPLVALIGANVINGMGLGFIGPASIGSLYRSLPAYQISRGTSAMFILNQVGGAIGVAIFALMIQRLSVNHPIDVAFQRAFTVGAAGMLVIAGVSHLLPGRVRSESVPGEAVQRPPGTRATGHAD